LHPLQPQNYLVMGRIYAALYDTKKEMACGSIAKNLFRNETSGLDLTTCSKTLVTIATSSGQNRKIQYVWLS